MSSACASKGEQCAAPRVVRPPPSCSHYPYLVLGRGRRGRLVVGSLLDGAVDHPQQDAVEADEEGRDRRAQQRLAARLGIGLGLGLEVGSGLGFGLG